MSRWTFVPKSCPAPPFRLSLSAMNGKALKQARRRAGLTQEELAARLGCSRRAIARWERGEVRPLRVFWEKLEKELNINIERIVNG